MSVKGASPPPYTFCTPSQQWSEQLLKDAPVPVCLTRSATDEALNSHIGDYTEAESGSSGKPSSWQYEIQFYLGQRDTGAPVHFHGHAINTLVFGEKVRCPICIIGTLLFYLCSALTRLWFLFHSQQWFLYPPSEAFYTTVPALESDFATQSKPPSGGVAPLRVTQRGGDVLYVPTMWAHGTLNTQQCIGVAHEFSVEAFCME